jgi:hypothetical protein
LQYRLAKEKRDPLPLSLSWVKRDGMEWMMSIIKPRVNPTKKGLSPLLCKPKVNEFF